MTASVRILSTSSVDASPAILLVAADGTKILVNCGEGCQRSFLEYGQRLSTVTTVLLCHVSHEAISGLPGAILTTADSAAAADASAILLLNAQHQRKGSNNNGNHTAAASYNADAPLPGLVIVGPARIKQFMHSLRHFMRRDKFQLTVYEGAVDSLQAEQQGNGRKRGAQKKKKESDASSSEQVGFTIQSLSFSDDNYDMHLDGSRKRHHDELKGGGQQVLSFIIKTPPIQGKFLKEKADELGVPKGPLYGKLKAGMSVTFIDTATDTERTVESAQVVTPASPAVAVLILYYPSVSVAKQLFSSGTLKATLDSKNVECDVELVIHIAPQELFDEHGLAFRKECDETVEHVFLSTDRMSDIDGTPFRSAGKAAKARALLYPSIYQVPRAAATSDHLQSSHGYRVGRATMEYTLIPRSRRGFTENGLLAENADDQEAAKLVEATGALAMAQEALAGCAVTDQLVAESTGELIFTGTGSAMPCKHRNVTGMLLKQADGRSILLDVGEGTIGQLLRAQPSECTRDILASIKAVWISHPHADHHLGLLRLLKDRRSAEPVLLLAPIPIFQFLDEYSAIDPSIRDAYYAIDCKYLVEDNNELRTKLQDALGISNCRAVPVAHCAHAYAVILDGTSFGRVVYSGDCRPSSQLAQAAKGADLLIHEATFENGMEAEAALKKHSTVGEALAVGREMECKCTILTHFSQRYPKIPPTPAGVYSFPIIFAFDYMRLQPYTLVVASKLTPALRLLFPETGGDGDDPDNDSAAAKAMSVPGVFAISNLL